MRVSELTASVISNYCRLDSPIEEELQIMKEAAVAYVKGYTGLSEVEIDEHEDITIAVLVLISDMYEQRAVYVDKDKPNRTVSTILGMHSMNCIAEEVV